MRRLLAVLAVALCCAGAAGADTFRVLPSEQAPTQSATIPNAADSLVLPPAFLTPPAAPQQLSFPQLQELWQRAGAQYGIPWQVLAAINKIESNLGQNMGPSSAGAVGWMQFMPETWLRWGTDGNGDGIADPWNADDAIVSAARYLAAAGGQTDIARAVFAYNHAQWYVDEVLQLAQVYAGGAQVATGLAELQQRVDDAQAAVVRASGAVDAALADVQRIAEAENRLLARAQAAELLSDRLTFEKAAADVDAQRAIAQGVVEQRRVELAQARDALEQARASAVPASFDPGARTLLSGASYDTSGYVFPVGGGPAVVSVSHTHHDYPAADIAAPEGSPLYALANGVVDGAWHDDARCGTGFTLRAEDGRLWTYCHLSFLDPAVTAGAVLSAGQQVGLVGSSGDATGPHLHLQLQPATSYPQDEAWFQAFAGSAFSWQDGGTTAAAPQREAVFAVVPDAPKSGASFAAAPQDGVVLFTR
jgi:murein DD-endopeptidase MepM/ murein hydrolase activator NlpD